MATQDGDLASGTVDALAGGTVPDAEELSRAAKALADRVSDPVTLPAVAAHIRRRFPV